MLFSCFSMIDIKLLVGTIVIVCTPMLGMGQAVEGNSSSEDLRSSFRVTVSTQLLMQRSTEIQSNTSGFSNQEELFYQNPVFGMSLDWYGWPYVALSPGISYYNGSATHFEDRSGAMIGFPGLYDDNYDFRLFLLEPGLKLSLPFKHAEVFWNGGPTIGFGSVKVETQVTPVRYENGEAIPRHEDTNTINNEENRRGIGFYFSTGISLPLSSSFRLQGEIGYRSLNLGDLEINTGSFRFSELNYQLDSFTPGLGITYMIR
jgi:hypothetical protein